jgi:hypothetical protein
VTLFRQLIQPVCAIGLLLSACTNPSTAALGTNVPLAPAPDLAGAGTPGVVVWRAPDLAERERFASAYFVPPAAVYRGQGSYYADLSDQQVDGIAAELTQEVRAAIGRRFKVADGPGPNVFTLDLFVVKIVPPREHYFMSGPYDFSELAVGRPEAAGNTVGTMTVAGKFLDSENGRLLVGFSAPVSPQVMDLPSPGTSARALDFAQIASEQFASDLVRAISRTRQNNRVATPR